MKQGILVYDYNIGRMDIKFSDEDYYGGLHCGEGLDVNIKGEWVPTRIEKSYDWYLVGLPDAELMGLRVRI